MRSTLFALLAFVATSAYPQEIVSPCDKFLKTEMDSATGAYSRSSKETIVIENASRVIDISVLIMDRTVVLSFTLKGDVYCLDEASKIEITFTDGSTLEMAHDGKFNCDGDFSLFFYGSFGKKKEFSQLITSGVQNVKIGLRKSTINKKRDNYVEATLPDSKATLLRETLACAVE